MQENHYFDTYAEVKAVQRTPFRNRFRDIVLDTVSIANPLFRNALKRPRVQFIYIHHVFRDEVEQLDKLIRLLAEDHQFISYSEGVSRVLRNQVDRPYVVFSSDDGLLNNMEAAQVFDRYGIKGCFFINPTMIGEKDFNRIRLFCKQQLHFPPVSFLEWKDVEALLGRGHEIGSHTMNHINMGAVPKEILRDEIHESYRIISERCGTVAHFAFPYGRFHHFNGFSRQELFAAGYQSLATAERGCHISDGNPVQKEALVIRRDHIILDWPIPHIIWFLQKNSLFASVQNNYYTGWSG